MPNQRLKPVDIQPWPIDFLFCAKHKGHREKKEIRYINLEYFCLKISACKLIISRCLELSFPGSINKSTLEFQKQVHVSDQFLDSEKSLKKPNRRIWIIGNGTHENQCCPNIIILLYMFTQHRL